MAGKGPVARVNAHNSYFKRMMVELNTGCTQARKGGIMRHICRIVCIPDPPEGSDPRVLCLTNVVAILTRAFGYDSSQDNRATQWYSQILTDTRIVANSVAKNNMTGPEWQQRITGSPMVAEQKDQEILDAAMGYGGGRRKKTRRKKTRRKRKNTKRRRKKRKKTRKKSKRRRKKRKKTRKK